jgi:glycosyltransferase involved in cell wall biosynthesis
MGTIANAAKLMEKDENTVFVLAGDGPKRTELEELIKRLDLDNVILIPFQDKERYRDLLAASDVCLVTLRDFIKTPAVPGKLQAIMAAGRVSIVSVPSVSDARGLVQELGAGIWVPPENPQALADAITYLRDHEPERHGYEIRAREAAERLFSLSSATRILESLLETKKSEGQILTLDDE